MFLINNLCAALINSSNILSMLCFYFSTDFLCLLFDLQLNTFIIIKDYIKY